MSSEPRILEWYRVDQTKRMLRVLVAGPGVLTLGGLVMAVSFVTHQPEAIRSMAATAGLLCTVGGALITVIGMQRALREEAYLAVRSDGIALRLGDGEELIAWPDLERVRFDEARKLLVFTKRSGEETATDKRFAGTNAPELAGRLDRLRVKAEWNLLVPDPGN